MSVPNGEHPDGLLDPNAAAAPAIGRDRKRTPIRCWVGVSCWFASLVALIFSVPCPMIVPGSWASGGPSPGWQIYFVVPPFFLWDATATRHRGVFGASDYLVLAIIVVAYGCVATLLSALAGLGRYRWVQFSTLPLLLIWVVPFLLPRLLLPAYAGLGLILLVGAATLSVAAIFLLVQPGFGRPGDGVKNRQ